MWETNKRDPDKNMLVKIAEFFNVSTDYLLGIDATIKIALSPVEKMLTEMEEEDIKKIVEYAQLMYEKYKKRTSKK